MSSSSSSSSTSSELPYFCPRCGDKFRFLSVPELRAHLVSQHTYETLLLLSQARVRSSRPGVLLPLPGPAVAQRQSFSLGMEAHSMPLQLACLDLASSSASIKLLREMFGSSELAPPATSTGCPDDPSTALALPGTLEPFHGKELGEVLEFGLSVGIGLEERLGLGLDRKIAQIFVEVEERVNRRMGRLKVALQTREVELERERWEGERLRSEKQEVEERAAYLSRQVSAAMEMTERIKKDLQGKEKELNKQQQEMVDIERFLRETAAKEAEAKTRLQMFIETLLERADHAERQLMQLSSHTHHNRYTHHNDKYTHADVYADPYTLTGVYAPVPGRRGRSLDGSTDDIMPDKMQETIGNRRSYSVSGSCRLDEQLHSLPHYSSRLSGGMWTSSLGLGGWDCEGGLVQLPPHHYPPPWNRRERGGGDGRRERFCYRSSSDPLCQEVLWALGAGCRNISSLQVAPAEPCQQPTRFGNRCLQTIGRCWPHLCSLSVGGASCGTQGLVAVVRTCAHLQVLELQCITDLGLQAATELCEAGLKSLQTLILTHTPVSGQAILHFHSVCDNLRSIVVEVSALDYFDEPDTEEARHLFGEILSTLKVLQQRPGLCEVLQVKAEGFC
nr:PREDICTED: F-box only protein 41-like [Paralichthys olivaceus]